MCIPGKVRTTSNLHPDFRKDRHCIFGTDLGQECCAQPTGKTVHQGDASSQLHRQQIHRLSFEFVMEVGIV